jgi:hypothetical protein
MRLLAWSLPYWAEVAVLTVGSVIVVVLSIIGLMGLVAYARLREYRNHGDDWR